MKFNRQEEAMAVAVSRLRNRKVINRGISTYSSTDASLLLSSVDIPLPYTDIRRLVDYINKGF